MTHTLRTLGGGDFFRDAAAEVASAFPERGQIIITGGGTAARLYEELHAARPDWSQLDVFFSDERCVPPDDERSNFGMAARLLLQRVSPRSVHRMRGEDEPASAAQDYHEVVTREAPDGFELALLGLGDDAHIAGLFPGSPALHETRRSCVYVERADGLTGLTLTPPVLLAARRIIFVVDGEGKRNALRRALAADEPVERCPAALLRDHPDVTFLADPAASGA